MFEGCLTVTSRVKVLARLAEEEEEDDDDEEEEARRRKRKKERKKDEQFWISIVSGRTLE